MLEDFMFQEVFWKEEKGMYVTIGGKDYFVYGGFNKDMDFVLEINKGFGDFITFDKDNNKEEYIYLLEKLSNYDINRFIYNNIVDVFNKLGVKHTLVKR